MDRRKRTVERIDGVRDAWPSGSRRLHESLPWHERSHGSTADTESHDSRRELQLCIFSDGFAQRLQYLLTGHIPLICKAVVSEHRRPVHLTCARYSTPPPVTGTATALVAGLEKHLPFVYWKGFQRGGGCSNLRKNCS